MPTGYTHPIKDGITFEQFALGCARAFGATIMMRDEPQDAPIPDEFKPMDYHAKKLIELNVYLEKLNSISKKEAGKLLEDEYLQELSRHIKRQQENKDLLEKYQRMLTEVKKWEPPTANHIGLKDFMIKQINESIEWDCDLSYDKEPIRKDLKSWLREKTDKTKKDILYHQKQNEEEIKTSKQRTDWVQNLKRSLKNQIV